MTKKTEKVLFKTIEKAIEYGANREYGEFNFELDEGHRFKDFNGIEIC